MTDPEDRGWVDQGQAAREMAEAEVETIRPRSRWERMRYWDVQTWPLMVAWLVLGLVTWVMLEAGIFRLDLPSTYVAGVVWGIVFMDLARTDPDEEYVDALYLAVGLFITVTCWVSGLGLWSRVG